MEKGDLNSESLNTEIRASSALNETLSFAEGWPKGVKILLVQTELLMCLICWMGLHAFWRFTGNEEIHPAGSIH